MQNVYLSNSIDKMHDLAFFKSYTLEYPRIDKRAFALNLFYSEGNASIYESGEDFLASSGVFIYKDEFNSSALKPFFRDLESGRSLKELLLSDRTRGEFCLFLYFKGELRVVTDRLGYFPLYCYRNKGIVEISNSFLMLARNNDVSLSHQGIAEYLSENIRGYACCDKNVANEIDFLDGGSIYTLRSQNLEAERYYSIKDDLKIARYGSFGDIADKAEEILADNLSFLKKVNGRVHADITGGIDTRVNIANLVRVNRDIHYGMQVPLEYRHHTNFGKYSELTIANRIAEHCHLDLDLYNDADYLSRRGLIDELAFTLSNKFTYARRAGYFLHLKDAHKVNIIVSGLSGTELLRQPYIEYFNTHKELKLDGFLREHYPLVDVMRDGLLKEDEYYNNLETYFRRHIDGLKYDKAEDIGNYIDFFAFYRTHFCKYFGLANSVVPFYTSYGDFRFVKLLLEAPYKLKARFKIQRRILTRLDPHLASIDTTRGFPCSEVNWLNFYRFANMVSRNIPQYHFGLASKIEDGIMRGALRFLFSSPKAFGLVNGLLHVQGNQSERLNLLHKPNDLSIIPALGSVLKTEMPVFDIVDKNKLEKKVKRDCDFNILNRVLTLNKVLEAIL